MNCKKGSNEIPSYLSDIDDVSAVDIVAANYYFESNTLWSAIQVFGNEHQVNIAIEEMSELIQALLKFRRFSRNDLNFQNLIEEIADVEIMMRQLKMIFMNNQQSLDEFNKVKELKIKRLEETVQQKKIELNIIYRQA